MCRWNENSLTLFGASSTDYHPWSRFFFKAEFGCIDIMVSRSRKAIHSMQNQDQRNPFELCLFLLMSALELLIFAAKERFNNHDNESV